MIFVYWKSNTLFLSKSCSGEYLMVLSSYIANVLEARAATNPVRTFILLCYHNKGDDFSSIAFESSIYLDYVSVSPVFYSMLVLTF